ncbi:hypothetical protein L7F22_068396 [Adiantum nelumboides]|nr:hypothetical protein [Adiantum nelumboides]
MRVLDVGCGVGGPAREIARFADVNIVGLNNNAYQVDRANKYTKKAGLENQVEFVKGDFMNLDQQFGENSFDAVYAIEATCHAPNWEGIYGQIKKGLKPGGIFGVYEWCMTDSWDQPIQNTKRLLMESNSDLSLLTSASSFPSGLGDQSDKEDSVGHGDTQSNLDGQNGNSGEQDGSHDPKSQKEEGKGDLGHGGGNRNEIGSSPNQEELPSQDRSPAQIAGSDNGGNGKHVGNNKVEVPDNPLIILASFTFEFSIDLRAYSSLLLVSSRSSTFLLRFTSSLSASPAVDALIATPTLVLDGLVHYLVRLLSGQELANFIFAPGVGDGGVALDSKASSFLELCVLEFNPELCSWLMEAVERVGQAYDCDVRFDSSKAEFLKILLKSVVRYLNSLVRRIQRSSVRLNLKLVVEKEAGLDIAIKVVEAAIENQMMKWIVSKASQYVEGGLEFPSELSEFILGLAGRAIKEADYLREGE